MNSYKITLTEDGFSVQQAHFETAVKWKEITEINAFKRDKLIYDSITVQVFFKDKLVEIDEEFHGWQEWIKKLMLVFPDIPENCFSNIVLAPFKANFTRLYLKP